MRKRLHARRFPKDGLSHCKRPSFTVQKATFRNAKDGLLENGRSGVSRNRLRNECCSFVLKSEPNIINDNKFACVKT